MNRKVPVPDDPQDPLLPDGEGARSSRSLVEIDPYHLAIGALSETFMRRLVLSMPRALVQPYIDAILKSGSDNVEVDDLGILGQCLRSSAQSIQRMHSLNILIRELDEEWSLNRSYGSQSKVACFVSTVSRPGSNLDSLTVLVDESGQGLIMDALLLVNGPSGIHVAEVRPCLLCLRAAFDADSNRNTPTHVLPAEIIFGEEEGHGYQCHPPLWVERISADGWVIARRSLQSTERLPLASCILFDEFQATELGRYLHPNWFPKSPAEPFEAGTVCEKLNALLLAHGQPKRYAGDAIIRVGDTFFVDRFQAPGVMDFWAVFPEGDPEPYCLDAPALLLSPLDPSSGRSYTPGTVVLLLDELMKGTIRAWAVSDSKPDHTLSLVRHKGDEAPIVVDATQVLRLRDQPSQVTRLA